jgi:hypothetical protein
MSEISPGGPGSYKKYIIIACVNYKPLAVNTVTNRIQ